MEIYVFLVCLTVNTENVFITQSDILISDFTSIV